MKTCRHCGNTWSGKRMQCPKCGESHATGPTYIPSQEEIQRHTAIIRAGWNEHTREKRTAQGTKPFIIPVVQDPFIEESFERNLLI